MGPPTIHPRELDESTYKELRRRQMAELRLETAEFRREMAELGARIDSLPYKLALANVPFLIVLAIITLAIAKYG